MPWMGRVVCYTIQTCPMKHGTALCARAPLVSIIIVVKDDAGHAVDSIRSVKKQHYTHWEIIILSKNIASLVRAGALLLKDSRIRHFEYEENDINGAQNIGLEKMRGEYFCFLRTGDVMPENSIASRMDVFSRSPEVDFVDGHTTLYDSSLTKILYTKNSL